MMELRDSRPLLLIDIAVPRDIDPTVRTLPGVTLYDMDDLQRQVARNLSVREAESSRARSLVEEEAQRYENWLATLEVVPTISALRERGDVDRRSRSCARTSTAGSRCPRPTASGSA